MRFFSYLFCGLLSLYSGAVSAQIAKIFDRNACGCVLDKKKLNDERYLNTIKIAFSPSKIKASFELNQYTNQQAVNFINLLADNLTSLEKNSWLQKLQEVDNELGRKFANSSLSAWNEAENAATAAVRKGKPIIGWLIYTTCELAETLHSIYLQNPELAPSQQRSFYQNPNAAQVQNEDNNFINKNNLTILERIKQVKMIYVIAICAAFSLLTLLLCWLLLRNGQAQSPAEQTETVLKDKQFKATLQNFAVNMEAQINAAFQTINDNIEVKFTAFGTGDNGGNNSDKLSQIEAKIDNIPVVNVQFIENFLTDIDKRMKQLENLPRSKGGFVIQSDELLTWIEENEMLQNALKKSLDIELLRDTIIKLQPQAWGGKELSELEKETIARMWKIYELKEEFLPRFRQQLIADVEKAVNKALNSKR